MCVCAFEFLGKKKRSGRLFWETPSPTLIRADKVVARGDFPLSSFLKSDPLQFGPPFNGGLHQLTDFIQNLTKNYFLVIFRTLGVPLRLFSTKILFFGFFENFGLPHRIPFPQNSTGILFLGVFQTSGVPASPFSRKT